MVSAMIIVPIVRVPSASTPISIARKSQQILTAKNGICEALLMIFGTASNGDSPESEFIYSDTDIRKKNSAEANTAALYGCSWKIH